MKRFPSRSMKYLVLPVLIIGLTASLWLIYSNYFKPKIQNLILISMDTTRYDYVDTGYGAKSFTPQTLALAEKSVVFDHAYVTTPLTLPSHLSILTSHYPHELGVMANEQRYDHRFKMIQEVFKEQGMRTAAVVSLGSLLGNTGISQGFDVYCDTLFSNSVFFVRGEQITEEAIRQLDLMQKDPFFLFAHYSDPHSPLAPPQAKANFQIILDGEPTASFNAYTGVILRMKVEFPEGTHHLQFQLDQDMDDFNYFVLRRLKFSENCKVSLDSLPYSTEFFQGSHIMKQSPVSVSIQCKEPGWVSLFQVIPILKKQKAIELYQQEVEYMDQCIGRLADALEERGLMKNTMVAVFADHGEGMGERESFFGHSRYLNQQFIHVPLFIYSPGQKHRHVQTGVSLTQLAPTLLEGLKIRSTEFPKTPSLFKIKDTPSSLTSEVVSYAYETTAQKDKFSIIKWPYQSIFSFEKDQILTREFYQIARFQSFARTDGIPESVMLKTAPDFCSFVEQRVPGLKEAFSSQANSLLDQENIEALKALGYVQ